VELCYVLLMLPKDPLFKNFGICHSLVVVCWAQLGNVKRIFWLVGKE